MNKTYLVSYCENEDIDFLKTMLAPNDILVGVDQGADLLFKNFLTPDFIIGDFDSFPVNESKIPEKCQIIRLNPDKDESDLEYAVRYFLDRNDVLSNSKLKSCPDNDEVESNFAECESVAQQREIIIINNMQGRIDHTLSVLGLLEQQYELTNDSESMKSKNKTTICILNSATEIYLSRGHFQKEILSNSTISLIPISDEVKKISTRGMLYELDKETLYRKKTRGISNKNIDKNIAINFCVGELLVVINKRI